MSRSRVMQHCLICISGLIISLAVYVLKPEVALLQNLSISTAYTSMLFLLTAVTIGPLNVIRKRRNPISSYLRRDLGIWCGIFGLTHTLIGLQVHFSGQFWLYFIYPEDQPHLLPIRYGPFGVANYLGLISAAILIVLMSLSRNQAIKQLGTEKWKSRQRLTYVLALAAIFHGFIYQYLESRALEYFFALIIILVIGLAMQSLGASYYKKKSST